MGTANGRLSGTRSPWSYTRRSSARRPDLGITRPLGSLVAGDTQGRYAEATCRFPPPCPSSSSSFQLLERESDQGAEADVVDLRTDQRPAAPPWAPSPLRLTPRRPVARLAPTIVSPLLLRIWCRSATKAESNFRSVGAMIIRRPEGPSMTYWLKMIGFGLVDDPCPEVYRYDFVEFPKAKATEWYPCW